MHTIHELSLFYTPSYLVDFILDRALPWEGTDWDLRILDPACGSGIFLVHVGVSSNPYFMR